MGRSAQDDMVRWQGASDDIQVAAAERVQMARDRRWHFAAGAGAIRALFTVLRGRRVTGLEAFPPGAAQGPAQCFARAGARDVDR